MNAVAVLIITCPCALGLAAPAVQIVATGRLFRAGVLVKSGDALERLSEVSAILFDKTGTLTIGKLCVANLPEISDETLSGAAQLARASRHPLSRAIVAAAGPGPLARNTVEKSGLGIEGEIEGAPAKLGKADWVGADHAGAAQTEVWYRRADGAPVRFVFADALRADARSVVEDLKKRGLTLAMLSGDHEAPAAAIARALDIDWRAPLSPQEKIEYVEKLDKAGIKVAMVGDGLNDAPSLAAAHASLSPGSAADASQAAADFVYQGDRLEPLVEAIDTARRARSRMRENFAFAALYNFCAVPLAALGLVTPLIAALAMSGSSIIVVLNALRLARGERSGP
jgi:Cu2+-exporting ATPase